MAGDAIVTAIGDYAHTYALKSCLIESNLAEFDYVDAPIIIDVFRKMIRELRYDVSEMALSTYLCAREHGIPLVALPVFLLRGFHHGQILVNLESGIRNPADLVGKRVGLRGYTVTSGVWVRGILASEYGVPLEQVHWTVFGDEHVGAYRAPEYVTYVNSPLSIADALIAGEIDAAIGIGSVDSPDIQPLIPNAEKAGLDYFRQSGVLPINHTLVIKSDLAETHPWLTDELWDLFNRSKDWFYAAIERGQTPTPDTAMFLRMRELLGCDPLPYGLDENQPTLNTFLDFLIEQQILMERPRLEDAFVGVDAGRLK